MTVGELMTILSAYPLDFRVVVTSAVCDQDDFEVAVDSADGPSTVELKISRTD